MPFCPNCGQPVGETARFCQNCGAELAASAAVVPVPTTPAAVQTPVTNYRTGNQTWTAAPAAAANTTASDYSLVLVSCGSCTKTTARQLLRDVLGYTAAEAKSLTDGAPIEIARMLTFQQALDVARMFTEYGMQIAVYNSSGYVDISQYATASVFQSNGNLIGTVAASLATLTIANRVAQFLRWSRPDPLRYLFAPRYRPAPPPRYRRPAPPPPPPPPRRPAPPRPGGLLGGLGMGSRPGGPGRPGGPRGGPGGPGGRGPGPGGRGGSGGPGGRR